MFRLSLFVEAPRQALASCDLGVVLASPFCYSLMRGVVSFSTVSQWFVDAFLEKASANARKSNVLKDPIRFKGKFATLSHYQK